MSDQPRILRIGVPCIVGTSLLVRDHPDGLDRQHPGVWNIHFIREGRTRCGRGPEAAEVVAGDLVAYAPDARMTIPPPPADGADAASWRWFVVADQPRFHPLLRFPEIQPGVGRIHLGDETVREQVQKAWDDIEYAYHKLAPPRRLELLFNLIERMLLWADAANPRLHASGHETQIANAILHLRLHFDERLTVADLAEVTGWTPSHFAHRFRDVTGTTPLRYLTEVRLRNACDLLRETDLDHNTIAVRCGFETAAYFNRVFRKHWNMPPGRWRREQRQRPFMPPE